MNDSFAVGARGQLGLLKRHLKLRDPLAKIASIGIDYRDQRGLCFRRSRPKILDRVRVSLSDPLFARSTSVRYLSKIDLMA